MAAAEARAVWQRTANRCFVQEDAKRAPKLACCQSSSSSSKQVDGAPTDAADMPDHSAVGFMPLDRVPSFSNLPPDTRWWLHLLPSYGYQKGLTYEQLNALEVDEMENLKAGLESPEKITEDIGKDDLDSTYVNVKQISEYSLSSHCSISADCMNRDLKLRKEEVKSSYKSTQDCNELSDARESSKLSDTDPIGYAKSQKSDDYCFDPESPWICSEKSLPWWRTDKDDLASLVAQKSLGYMENCDLPPPQKIQIGRYHRVYSGSSDSDNKLPSTLDWRSPISSNTSAVVHAQSSPTSEGIIGRYMTAIDGRSQSGPDNSYNYSTTHKETPQVGEGSENDACKAQLLEALRHSQTRAREAEKAAKQACAEKEHVIKLFFRQASQLFAYKQWFQMLQLETIYHQMKNSEQPMSTIFPVVLPWMPQKGRKLRKNWQKSTKGKRGKRGRAGPDVSKYAVAFALGLSLVGAGLLLGWTVGWMLPF